MCIYAHTDTALVRTRAVQIRTRVESRRLYLRQILTGAYRLVVITRDASPCDNYTKKLHARTRDELMEIPKKSSTKITSTAMTVYYVPKAYVILYIYIILCGSRNRAAVEIGHVCSPCAARFENIYYNIYTYTI